MSGTKVNNQQPAGQVQVPQTVPTGQVPQVVPAEQSSTQVMQIKPIRPIGIGALNLKGIDGAVRVFSSTGTNGAGYEIDAGHYDRTQLNTIPFQIKSLSVPPMTKISVYTSNAPSASGQLVVSNTKTSALVISELGMIVNSLLIEHLETNTSNKTKTEPFDNTAQPIPKYTTPEMAFFLIFILILIYVIYALTR